MCFWVLLPSHRGLSRYHDGVASCFWCCCGCWYFGFATLRGYHVEGGLCFFAFGFLFLLRRKSLPEFLKLRVLVVFGGLGVIVLVPDLSALCAPLFWSLFLGAGIGLLMMRWDHF